MYIILNSYVGAGDPRDEVSNAAKSYLYGLVHKFHANESPSSEDKGQLLLPDFLEMSKLVIEKANMRIKTQQKVTIGSHVLPFTPGVYTEILNYLRMCLIYNSGVVPHLDMLRDPQTEAPKIFEYISQFVVHHNENSNPFSQLKDISQSQNTASKEVLKKLIHLNEIFLSATQGTPQAQCLLQLLGCSPQEVWSLDFQSKMPWLKSLLNNTKEDFREVSSQLYGQVAASFPMGPTYVQSIADLFRGFKDKPLEFQV